MKTRFPWLRMRKKTDPELPLEPPLWMGDLSNGEYYSFQTEHDRKLRRFILEKADENARRVGIDRREFLASAMGMVTTLWCIQYVTGCSGDDENSGASGRAGAGGAGGAGGGAGAGGVGGGTGGAGGGVGGAGGGAGGACVPEAMFDPNAACTAIGGNEFIFDVQTHWFSTEDMARFPPSIKDTLAILGYSNEDAYINGLFLNSDTTMTVLTSWPGTYCSQDPANMDPCGLPLSNDRMAASRDRLNRIACNTQRVVNHFQLLPTDRASIQEQKDLMTKLHCERRVHGWKMYPGFNPSAIDPMLQRGYFLTDPNARALIEHGLSLGVNRFSVHKGLAIGTLFEAEHNHPRDVGPAARDYPGANFIIYHSAVCAGYADAAGNSTCTNAAVEGAYDPADPDPRGANAFIRSLLDAGIQPNANVYAEVGSAIDRVMRNNTAAQHFFGKLMKHVGVDRVVWGTDCLITRSSPQPYIEWFRALPRNQALEQQFGYPPLDDAAKRKIFGLNAAQLYGVDVAAKRCEVNACPTAEMKRLLDEELGERRWVFDPPLGPRSYDECVEHSRKNAALGRPG